MGMSDSILHEKFQQPSKHSLILFEEIDALGNVHKDAMNAQPGDTDDGSKDSDDDTEVGHATREEKRKGAAEEGREAWHQRPKVTLEYFFNVLHAPGANGDCLIVCLSVRRILGFPGPSLCSASRHWPAHLF
ncbi:hypothetical protein DPSP01_004537 [Paraphaeosphaeria sporulosa]